MVNVPKNQGKTAKTCSRSRLQIQFCDAANLILRVKERLCDKRIKVRSRILTNDGERLFDGERLLVAAAGHQRVEHIRYCHHARRKRDLLPP